MSRIKIESPGDYHYSTEIRLRISDINYGGHLGHDSILSIAHEARVRFLVDNGFSELDIGGSAIIMADVAVQYKSESFYGDTLKVELAVCEYSNSGCDIVYVVTEKKSGKEIAYVKTGIVFFNYAERSVDPVPEAFKELFPPKSYLIEVI